MDFRTKLLQFRAKHNMTQKEASIFFEVNVNSIARYETGRTKPSNVNLIKFENKMKEWEEKEND